MREIKIEDLKEVKLHFGHRTFKWNPKFKPFIFKKQYGMHFIDLEKSKIYLEKAMKIAKELGRNGKKILWVGTKKQAAPIIKEWAEKTNSHYVNLRWFAGTLTNFNTIHERLLQIEKLEDIIKHNGQMQDRVYNKKEMVKIKRDYEKLNKNLAGLRGMKELPDMIFVVDVIKENIAIKEAKKLHIPIMAIVDSNVNPQIIDYVIPGSDDAIRAIEYVVSAIAEAYNEGRGMYEKKSVDDNFVEQEERKMKENASEEQNNEIITEEEEEE